jgi:hypothetical protein
MIFQMRLLIGQMTSKVASTCGNPFAEGSIMFHV